jgi:hypothetical protein
MHRAYAGKARFVIPTLKDYERELAVTENVIVPMTAAVASGELADADKFELLSCRFPAIEQHMK